MYTSIAIGLLTALLAGCAATSNKPAQANPPIDSMDTVYARVCEKRGYQSQTPEWQKCMKEVAAKGELGGYGAYFPAPWRIR